MNGETRTCAVKLHTSPRDPCSKHGGVSMLQGWNVQSSDTESDRKPSLHILRRLARTTQWSVVSSQERMLAVVLSKSQKREAV